MDVGEIDKPSQVMDALRQQGVVKAVIWAVNAGARQALDDHHPQVGYNQSTLGTSCHHLVVDRLNRVFRCGKYSDAGDQDMADGSGLLDVGLPKNEVDSMPEIDPGLVCMGSLNGSPGWIVMGTRLLLQAYPPQGLNKIRWAEKSETKKSVAQQGFYASEKNEVQTLINFAELANSPKPNPEDLTNLIIAYAVDELSSSCEISIGCPRYVKYEQDPQPWHWVKVISSIDAGHGISDMVGDSVGPTVIGDVPVTLRKRPDVGLSE